MVAPRRPALTPANTMRIGKPLLIIVTAIGLPIGIYEGFHLAGPLGFVMVMLIGFFGAQLVSFLTTLHQAHFTRFDKGLLHIFYKCFGLDVFVAFIANKPHDHYGSVATGALLVVAYPFVF